MNDLTAPQDGPESEAAPFGEPLDHAPEATEPGEPAEPADAGEAPELDAERGEPDPVEDPEAQGRVERIVSWVVVGLCMVFVFGTLHPGLLLSDTTPTGGDMGAHVWGPQFLADHLLPNFRLTGWTQDWYAGFPAYVFYMVVPSLLIVWLAAAPPLWLSPILLAAIGFGVYRLLPRLSARWQRMALWGVAIALALLVIPIPYNIAFKLVTVSGLVTLPLAAYALARAAKAPFPVPPLVAIATLPFIYDRGFTILGGNGASTMAGEFAFSISLTFALLYLAVMFRGIRTGRDRALGAVLLGLTVLCHLIPAIFAGIATFVLLWVRREDRTPWWDGSRWGRVVGALVAVVALVPLVQNVRLPGGFEISGPLPQWLFPAFATVAAILLLSGFEPRLDRRWLTLRGRIAGAVLLVAGAAFLVLEPTWMTMWVLGLALVVVFFGGIDDRLVRWLLPVVPLGALLTTFWALPFLASSTYMNDMGWEKYTRYRDYLLADVSLDSGGMPYRNIVYALAGLGVVLALLHRVRFGWFLAATVLAFAWIFRYFPQYRLWNARLLPFLYLAIYLLAALGIGLAIRSIAIAVSDLRHRRLESIEVNVAGLAATALVVLILLLASFRVLPGGQQVADPGGSDRSRYRWAGVDFETGIVPDWARWNYQGLEDKEAYPEFAGIIEMMEDVAGEHGCGRAMWEYESDLQRFGTPMALMLLPYFTDGCIGSMEGLYFEASSTTPFHFLNQSALSEGPSRAQRDMPYTPFDINLGVSQLQMLGVRYYMATTPTAIEAARGHEDLTEVASETFPAVAGGADPDDHTWVVFEVADSDLVTGLERTPVVLEDADDHIDGWVYAAEEGEPAPGQTRAPKQPGPAVLWFQDPTRWDTHLATSGPDDWPVASAEEAGTVSTELPDVEVSNIETTQSSISFDVDQTGVPVLVRTSYFPNWQADGADGPYRVSPNFMAVVPTEGHVTLSYGRSPIELVAWLLTLVGVVGVVLLARRDLRDGELAAASDAADSGSVDGGADGGGADGGAATGADGSTDDEGPAPASTVDLDDEDPVPSGP